MKPRNRTRERAGKSESSWIKQGMVRQAAQSQAFAYRRANPAHRIVLVDGNAGDGVGVTPQRAQRDLFPDTLRSYPTPQTLVDVAASMGRADVILCEKDKAKREGLKALFPQAIILANNKDALAQIRADHCYALWLSDPNGPAGHGVETMRALACNPRIRSDFVVVFNEGFTIRVGGTNADDPRWATSRERYLHMAPPLWWAKELRKTSVAYSPLISQSPNFRFRLLIAANYLGDMARRQNFTIDRTKPRLVPRGED